MILLVNDAGILIDLLKADLITPFFQLEYEFHVTDFVAAEVQEDNAYQLEAFVSSGRLNKKTFDFDELLEIQRLELQHKSLSIPDCSCLYLSAQLSATLLTGDSALKSIAVQQNIPVHGFLWVLDELVNHRLISKNTAYEKLQYICSFNSRLPFDECSMRLAKWKKGR